jgi:hypothetical protein
MSGSFWHSTATPCVGYIQLEEGYMTSTSSLHSIHCDVHSSLHHNHASVQMLVARSLTSCNFRFMSSAASKLPSSCDAKPHWGETQMRCNASPTVSPAPLATMRAASNTRSLRSALSSSFGNLLVMRPKTTDLCLGRCRKGSNVPAMSRQSPR